MTWTKFMPEKPGHYWALRSDGKEPSMVEIAYFIAGSKVKLCRRGFYKPIENEPTLRTVEWWEEVQHSPLPGEEQENI